MHRGNGEGEVVDSFGVYTVDFDAKYVVLFAVHIGSGNAVERGNLFGGDTADAGHDFVATCKVFALCFGGKQVGDCTCRTPVGYNAFKLRSRRLANVALAVAVRVAARRGFVPRVHPALHSVRGGGNRHSQRIRQFLGDARDSRYAMRRGLRGKSGNIFGG